MQPSTLLINSEEQKPVRGMGRARKTKPPARGALRQTSRRQKGLLRKREGAPQEDEAVTLKTFTKALAYEPNLVTPIK